MRRVVLLGIAVLGVVCACLVLWAKPELARACGGFFNPAKAKDQRKPALAYEQTLIIFDSQKRREHFVREVVFRTSRQTFGFVVPTPTRPEVARVATSPFPRLRALFRFENLDIGTGSGQGFGAGPARGKVKVLEVKKVGSFTAFVLSADDATALADWLKKNQLVSSPEADVWLAHYVKMKFFYVAMRYDPPAKEEAVGRTTSETMRISFDSELAYYPYFEPDPPGGRAPDEPRMLDVWYAGDSRSVPVATRSEGKKVTWVRPFQEGIFYEKPRPNLTIALGDDAKLLPDGELVLQRFIDQKRSRIGFGDVVFVPAKPSSKKSNEPRSLIGVLDPALVEGAKR